MPSPFPLRRVLTPVAIARLVIGWGAVGALAAAGPLLAAPVALHRALFRQHQLALIVTYAHYLAFAGLTLLGLALFG